MKQLKEELSVRQKAFLRWDTDQNDLLSFDEYSVGQKNKDELERRFKYFDTNGDSQLTHGEFK